MTKNKEIILLIVILILGTSFIVHKPSRIKLKIDHKKSIEIKLDILF